jgi:hypothetical protein
VFCGHYGAIVRILLRLIAAWFGLAAVVLLMLLLHIGDRTKDASAAAVGAIGLIVVLTCVSLFTAIQLWRLRDSGRLTGVAVCVAAAGLTLSQFRALSGAEVIRLAVVLFVMMILLSRAARRACGALGTASGLAVR